jgi:hypothetical protein
MPPNPTYDIQFIPAFLARQSDCEWIIDDFRLAIDDRRVTMDDGRWLGNRLWTVSIDDR